MAANLVTLIVFASDIFGNGEARSNLNPVTPDRIDVGKSAYHHLILPIIAAEPIPMLKGVGAQLRFRLGSTLRPGRK
jgi:hypothetical protein